MHDPISSGAMGSFAFVKNKGLLHPNKLMPSATSNLLVNSSSLPIPRPSTSARPVPVGILHLSGAKEIPFLLPITCTLFNNNSHLKCPHITLHQIIHFMLAGMPISTNLANPKDQTCRRPSQG